ncbi:hypothetical protein, partial [Citrobacter freundii]|uniref:hypothetical protein n=1 Tax=Citrobacter freundii TaxID=546 RepID=UPI003B435AC1
TEVRRCNSSSDPACTIGNTHYDFVSDRVNVDKANMRGVESTYHVFFGERKSNRIDDINQKN